MIVKDEETMEQALHMLRAEGSARYSDQYAYIIITTVDTLELQCRRALARNDIAIVVPRGRESEMEDHSRNLHRIREQRAAEEKRKIKEWVRDHPEIVEKFKKKLE